MRDTMRLTGIARSVLPDATVVVVANRAGHDKKGEIPAKEFERSGETKVDFVLPDDIKACTMAANNGKPLLDVAKGAKITVALRQMTEGLVGSKKGAKRPPGWRRLFKK
jgi:Flp pilus assembly CpaE family ATPase